MLHDVSSRELAVDSEAALEFMKEATKLATTEELQDVGHCLEQKSELFAHRLAADRIGDLDEDGLRAILDSIFSLRRKTKRLLRHNPLERLREELSTLLYGAAPIDARFDRMVASVEGLDRSLAIALASEALHFTLPDRYWLWTHWIWNPGQGTGALKLVLQDEAELTAPSEGGIYHRVGEATSMVAAHGQAVGYGRSGRGLFGTDVFLACVYAVYMYTVFRIKLSQEFNRILPELPELVRRVLGVHRMGAIHARA